LSLALFTLLLAGCNSYFYWPKNRLPIPKSPFDLQIRNFESQDGTRLQGWLVPSKTGESKGLVVFCHGSDSHVGDYYEAVEFIPRHGFDLFMFDYRGYGASEGRPTREGTIADTHAAIDYAKKDPALNGTKVVLYGISLGAGIAIVTAAQRPDIIGVIAESGFTSYREIGRKVVRERWKTWPLSLFAPLLVSNGYDPIDYIDKISPRPVYVVHGDQDELVPCQMAEALYARAKEPKRLWMIRGGTHYSPPSKWHPEFERRLAGYLDYMFLGGSDSGQVVKSDCLPGGTTYD
jgi:fermentation-respiration switch protein FrsA (DUF1100 family)